MIIIGAISLLIGLLLVISFMFSRIKCRTETEAVIVKIIEKKHYYRGRNVKYCTPVFTYTINNKAFTAKADSFTLNSKKYFVGQKITVFTDANNPEKVRFGSNISFLIEGLVILAFGAFTIIITLI